MKTDYAKSTQTKDIKYIHITNARTAYRYSTRVIVSMNLRMMLITLCTYGCVGVEYGDENEYKARVNSINSALESPKAPSKDRPWKRIGRGRSPLDNNEHWKAFHKRFPKAAAWSVRDRLDATLIPKGIEASNWSETKKRRLGAITSLDQIWPKPRTIEVDKCDFGLGDCDPENPLRYEITDPSEEVREKVRDLLFEHLLSLVDEYKIFGVSSGEVIANSKVLEVRRSILGFDIAIERTAGGFPVHGGPQRVFFDSEGRIFGINKGFITKSEHAKVEAQARRSSNEAEKIRKAQERVLNVWQSNNSVSAYPPTVLRRVERTYNANRGRLMDIIHLTNGYNEGGHMVHLDTESGEIFTDYTKEDMYYIDATLKRSYYPMGDLLDAEYGERFGVYTRDSNELVHDFVYVMSDTQCDYADLEECETCPPNFLTPTLLCSRRPLPFCAEAYDEEEDGRIKATTSFFRDFGALTGADAIEGHVYHWATAYMEWQKHALVALGLLPALITDYEKVLLIANACRLGTVHLLEEDQFVRTNKNYLTDSMSRIFVPNHAEEDDDGSQFEFNYVTSPPLLAHELNHFVMHKYLGVNSDIDCEAGEENKLFHEGVLGTLLPHLSWHSWYYVGYYYEHSLRYWKSDEEVGRIHTGPDSLMTRTTHPCGTAYKAYKAGRVLGQALWKIRFGIDFDGNDQVSIPSLDRWELTILAYLSSYFAQDRSLEYFAYAFTFLAVYLNAISLDDAEEWCTMFDRHELADEFGPSCSL